MGDKALLRSDLYQGEDTYFKENKHVTGMAAEDGLVILNPYSDISDDEKNAVYLNEASRLWMRANGVPNIGLTKEQEDALGKTTYAKAGQEDKVATIIARILSGDPSAGNYTKEQKMAAESVLQQMLDSSFQDGFNSVRGK
jgi:hypothetical protein